MIEVRRITAAETIPIRHAVLRSGRLVQEALFSGDDDPATIHLGAFRDGQLLAVASLFKAPLASEPDVPAFQLRGMATAAGAQRSGLGSELLKECLRVVKENGARLLWCNARAGVIKFYERFGFRKLGELFEISNIGSHQVMRFDLE